MILYGRNVVREFLNGGGKIYELFVLEKAKDAEDIISRARKKGIKISFLDKRSLDKKAGTDKHQGMLINAEGPRSCGIDEFLEKHRDEEEITAVIIDGVTDPGNLGAIIRSCEIFGCCGIIMALKNTAPVNDAVFKASAGAVNHIDIVKESNINNVIKRMKKAGFWIYGLDLKGDKFLDETEFDRRTALILGSEGEGMKKLVKENCDFLIRIRQKGRLDSLNVSNAAAIVLYENMKQKS